MFNNVEQRNYTISSHVYKGLNLMKAYTELELKDSQTSWCTL